MQNTSLPLADYAVVGIYLLAVLAAGFWFTRLNRTGRDFFVGGNRIPWWAAGISLYMTTFSAWMFTGAASFVYNTGWFGVLFLGVKALGFLTGFLMSAAKWRRARITSPVEYVDERYNKQTHLLLSVILIVSMMYWPGHHLASVAKICAPALFPGSDWAVDGLILFFGVFVLVYTVAGGIWAVSMTDVLQFLVLVSVCIGLLFAVVFTGDMGSPEAFMAALPPLEFEHSIRGNVVYTHWYIIGFVASGVFSHAVADKAQRFFLVKDERAAYKAGWLTFALFLTMPVLFGLPPLIGKVLWPEISQLAAVAGSSKPDESIFIAVVLRYMPLGVVGLFLAAMIAASMSALDSVWNTVSAIISLDLYKGHLRPGATDKEVLWVGRLAIVGLTVAAVTMALLIVHSEIGIFTISNIVMGLVALPLTVPLFVGIVSRRPCSWAAIPAILSGIAIAAVTRFDLNWTLGPQYLAVIFVSLLSLFSSRWLGALFLRSSVAAVAGAAGVSALIWGALAVVDAPTMTLGVSRSGFGSLWLLVALAAIVPLHSMFAREYAKELHAEPERIGRFFSRIATPVDVSSELGTDPASDQPGRIIFWAALGLGCVPLLLLIAAGGDGWRIYGVVSTVLLGIAAIFSRTVRKAN